MVFGLERPKRCFFFFLLLLLFFVGVFGVVASNGAAAGDSAAGDSGDSAGASPRLACLRRRLRGATLCGATLGVTAAGTACATLGVTAAGTAWGVESLGVESRSLCGATLGVTAAGTGSGQTCNTSCLTFSLVTMPSSYSFVSCATSLSVGLFVGGVAHAWLPRTGVVGACNIV